LRFLELPARSRWIFILSLSFVLVLTPRIARGQSCYERCQDSCRGLNGLITSQGCVDNCNRAYCENRNTNQPTAPFGAIAYGDNRAEGISYHQRTQAEADQVAIATCSKSGPNCKVVYRYRDTCAAIAVALGGQHYESATGESEEAAQANATSACQQKGDRCKSNLSACSLTGAAPPRAPSAVSWGAIAYSTADMAAGVSKAKSDQASAESEAMAVCSQRGKACTVRIAFNKQCGALAADRNFSGSGAAANERDAQQKAMDDCARAGGTRCVLHVSFCTF
jgi:hypothetical protein